jgi:hypothetical protein
VANGSSTAATAADLVEDKLWLPTERELFGNRTNSNATYETEANQARLEYYTTAYTLQKYTTSNATGNYFTASPAYEGYFCTVSDYGLASTGSASSVLTYCAPAFCIK